MRHKPFTDSYLMSLTKAQIIELLRIVEHNFFGIEEALNNSTKAEMEIAEKYNRAKELLKLTLNTNYSLYKSCHNCSHFTSDFKCDIGKYLYGTGEKECEWEWEHKSKIINFLQD